jgi:hypothetical protein
MRGTATASLTGGSFQGDERCSCLCGFLRFFGYFDFHTRQLGNTALNWATHAADSMKIPVLTGIAALLLTVSPLRVRGEGPITTYPPIVQYPGAPTMIQPPGEPPTMVYPPIVAYPGAPTMIAPPGEPPTMVYPPVVAYPGAPTMVVPPLDTGDDDDQ